MAAALSAAASPDEGAQGISYCPGPYSGRNVSGSRPACRNAANASGPNGSTSRWASKEKPAPGSKAGPSSMNSCSKEEIKRSPVSSSSQERACLSNVRGHASQGLPSVFVASQRKKWRGEASSQRSTRNPASPSGRRRRSPVEPHGFGSAIGPKGVSAWSAGTQPTPPSRRDSSSETGTERPRVRPDRSQWRKPTSSSPRMIAPVRRAVVPVAQPEPRLPQPSGEGFGRGRPADAEHPAFVPVAPFERRRDCRCRLQVVAVPAKLRVGVAEDDEGAARTAHARGNRQEMPAVPVRRWRLYRTAEQVVEQKPYRRA